MDIWRSVGNNSGEVVSRLRCSPVDERLSDSVNRKSYRTNSGNTQCLTRRSTNTRHGLTICTQKATRFNKGSCNGQ